MKVKRHKRVRKNFNYYKVNFGVIPPYRVILDGDFLHAALEGRVMLEEQMPKVCQEKTTVQITKCVLEELRKRGKLGGGAFFIGSKLSVHECKHKKGFMEPHACIMALLGKKNEAHLCVGAQDIALRAKIRQLPGVPLFFLRGNVPIMESPSHGDKLIAHAQEEEKQSATVDELAYLEALDGKTERLHGTKRKAKEPNPLANKKKQKTGPAGGGFGNLKNKDSTKSESTSSSTTTNTTTGTESTTRALGSDSLRKKKKTRTRTKKGNDKSSSAAAPDAD